MDIFLLRNRVLAWILPHHCPLCLQPSHQFLCSPCFETLPCIHYGCAVCSLPLYTGDVSVCGECQKHPPAFERVIAAFSFESPVGHFINQFKHRGKVGSVSLMVDTLTHRINSIAESDPAPDLITSVPLHWTTLLRRGFNQSEIIARLLAEKTGLPYRAVARKRVRTSKQQVLSRRERLYNLKQVFNLRADVAGKYVVVVDDVVTTGATAETLARLLKKAGARRVDMWALARTPKH